MSTSKRLEAYETELFNLYRDAITLRRLPCMNKKEAMALRLRLYGFRTALQERVTSLGIHSPLDWQNAMRNAFAYKHTVEEQGARWYVVMRPRPPIVVLEEEVPEEQIAESFLEMERIQAARSSVEKDDVSTTSKRAQDNLANALAAIGYVPGKQSGNSIKESQGSEQPSDPRDHYATCPQCKRGYVKGFGVKMGEVEYCNTVCMERATKEGNADMDF